MRLYRVHAFVNKYCRNNLLFFYNFPLGIAPMRALLQEREYRQKGLSGPAKGSNILYFGCKKSSEDYIYRDELEGFQARGVLDQVHVAFSREQSEKVSGWVDDHFT